MTSQFKYSQIVDIEDVQQFGDILEQCFLSLSGEGENFINQVGVENIRLIRQSHLVVGGLAMIPMGQWWGGQRVPMTGIAGVGVTPESRGTGVAIALVQDTVKELHRQGVPLSVLYPATQHLYRKAGYEQGGTACKWEVSTQSIQVREQPLPVTPVVPINHEVFHDL